MAPSATGPVASSAPALVAALPYRIQESLGASVKSPLEEDPANYKNTLEGPLSYSGALDEYEFVDLTAVIGREYPKVQVSELLEDDAKLRDLAVTISQRGVVFFRNQDITKEQQKLLTHKLGELTGKPANSKLHVHAVRGGLKGVPGDPKNKLDPEITVVSSVASRKNFRDNLNYRNPQKNPNESWHADISFETIPADYASLRIETLPEDIGGDTLFASGYDVYDRLSPAWKQFVEGLSVTHYQPSFHNFQAQNGTELIDANRGSPLNRGTEFKASHPLVRTNPVTGWKSIFGAGQQTDGGWVDGVTDRESEIIKSYLKEVISLNYDLQVRFRWGKNDLALWDNRSVFHTAISDYEGARVGYRVLSLGEKPYYDPKSLSRREALRNEVLKSQ